MPIFCLVNIVNIQYGEIYQILNVKRSYNDRIRYVFSHQVSLLHWSVTRWESCWEKIVEIRFGLLIVGNPLYHK